MRFRRTAKALENEQDLKFSFNEYTSDDPLDRIVQWYAEQLGTPNEQSPTHALWKDAPNKTPRTLFLVWESKDDHLRHIRHVRLESGFADFPKLEGVRECDFQSVHGGGGGHISLRNYESDSDFSDLAYWFSLQLEAPKESTESSIEWVRKNKDGAKKSLKVYRGEHSTDGITHLVYSNFTPGSIQPPEVNREPNQPSGLPRKPRRY